MIEVREALKRLCDEAQALEAVDIALAEAQGLVLAESVAADRDFPPTDRSAMDGFAVRAADLAGEVRSLRIVGEVRAGGAPGPLSAGPGEAVRIMTGAVLPAGTDAVVMVEQTHEEPERERVTILDRPVPGQHVRRRGEDVRCGDTVLEAGRAIHAPEIAALAAVGRTRPRVHRPPRVSVLSTGDEIVEPEEEPAEHQVRNSNACTLLAQLRELGLTGDYLGIAADDRGVLDARLEQGLSADVLLVTGGVSAGDYDLVADALESAGVRFLFHRVAVKPGKPILAGRRGACLVVGLPGNPVSTYTGFAIFVAPALRRMMGHRAWRSLEQTATLERPLRAGPKRQTYHLARITATRDGLAAAAVPTSGSADVVSLARANGFVVTSVGCGDLPAGARVPVIVWRDFHLR